MQAPEVASRPMNEAEEYGALLGAMAALAEDESPEGRALLKQHEAKLRRMQLRAATDGVCLMPCCNPGADEFAE